MRLVVAITGASGAIYGIRILERLRDFGVETHLVMSKWGERTIRHETSWDLRDVRALATKSYGAYAQAAEISSGSFLTDGMIVAPCSMHSLAAIAHGLADNLVVRAADVTLKERRRLVLLVRETPLSEVHLKNMLAVTRAGGIIATPVPAFYTQPATVDQIVMHTVMRALDLFGLHDEGESRWEGRLDNKKTGDACSS